MIIDGLEYHTSEENFNHYSSYGGRFAYFHIGDEWYDKNNIRVYNHTTKEHYFLEKVWPNLGDNNLLFIDFPRTDAPIDSWSSHATQYAKVRSWAHSHILSGDFVRFTIESIDKDNYCKITDGHNYPHGWYARDCFYKIQKIFKM